MNSIERFLVVAAATVAVGCSTVGTKVNGSLGSPYSGAECGYYMLNNVRAPPEVMALHASDVLLSAAADTVLLPLDLAVKNSHRKVDCEWWR